MTNKLNASATEEKGRLKASDFSDNGNHFNILVQGKIAFSEDIHELLLLGEKAQGYQQDLKLISGENDPESIRNRVSLSNKFVIDDIQWVSENGYPPISHYCGLKFVGDLYVAKKSENKNRIKQLLDLIHASQAALILQGHIDLAQDIFNAAGAFARLDLALEYMADNPFNGSNKNISRIRILLEFLNFLEKSQIPSQKALRNAVAKGMDDGQFSRAIRGMRIKMVIPEESKNPHKGQKSDRGTVYNLEVLSPNFDEIEEAQEIALKGSTQVTGLEQRCAPRPEVT